MCEAESTKAANRNVWRIADLVHRLLLTKRLEAQACQSSMQQRTLFVSKKSAARRNQCEGYMADAISVECVLRATSDQLYS
jgi:hypothetical protein